MARRNSSIDEPGIGGTVAKAGFGLVFVGMAFTADPGESDPVFFTVTCIVVGLALLAWALLPWIAIWREDAAIEKEVQQRFEEERRQREAEENAPRVCPGCGATGRGDVCEYCGTRLK